MSKKIFTLFIGFFACLIFVSQACSQELKFQIERKENEIHCTAGSKPVFVYRTSPSSYDKLQENEYKTYVSELYTPEGRNVLRDSPWDHVHHHALMFAIAADDVNFWEELGKDKAGVQLGRVRSTSTGHGWTRVPDGPNQWTADAAIIQEIDWYKPDKTIVLQENRKVRVVQTSDCGATLLTWTSKLSAGSGRESVKLSGAHYYGLGMRFDQTMDKNGTFFCDSGSNMAGDNVRGDEKKTPCKWMAYTADLHGQPVTVAVFDCPENSRPMSAFTMGETGQSFAYIAATVDVEKEPILLEKEKPLTFEYGVAVWEGKKSTEEVQKACDFWLDRRNERRRGTQL